MDLETSVPDSNSKDDITYAIEFNRRIAEFVGIWPISTSRQRDRIMKKVKIFVSYCLLLFITIPGVLHVVLEERNFQRAIMKTAPILLNAMALVKYSVLISRQNAMRNCIKVIQDDWANIDHEEHRQLMLKNSNPGRRLTRLCALTLYCGGLFYRLIKTLLARPITTKNVTIRPLPIPMYQNIPINASATPAYEIIFSTQMLASFTVHSTTITACGFAAICASHACGQLDVVNALFRKLIDGETTNLTFISTVQSRIRQLVQLHLRILSFVDSVEELLHEICLIEICGNTFMLCLTGFYFVTGVGNTDLFSVITYLVMTSAILTVIFTYCYIGELLASKVEDVGKSSYMIDWYRLPGKTSLGMIMIISISRSPIRLTAGKMFELSMNNFGSILRSAVGYLNLLRTMTDT